MAQTVKYGLLYKLSPQAEIFRVEVDYRNVLHRPALGSAALLDAAAVATKAQGDKAETAVQPEQLSVVAKTGSYGDLTGRPALAAVAASGAYPDLTGKPIVNLVERDLGSLPRISGTFDITGLSGLTPGNPVMIHQTAGAYTGKGTLSDEAELDVLKVSAFVFDASTIRAYWHSLTGMVAGNFKFCYFIP